MVIGFMPWKQVQLRGKEVFARCDSKGIFRKTNGRVEIRYGTKNSKPYFAYEQNLEFASNNTIHPDEYCAEASPQPDTAQNFSSKKSASFSTKKNQTPPFKTSASQTRIQTKETASHFPNASEDGKIIAYADGACLGNPGPSGVGVVILSSQHEEELSEYLGQGTNNIAELTAILRILERLETTKTPLEIYTDSKYSMGVIGKNWKAKANKELIENIRSRIPMFPNLTMIYVPGHQGVELNERVDQLARDAVETRQTLGWLGKNTQ